MGLFDHLLGLEEALYDGALGSTALNPDEVERLLAIALGRISTAMSFAARAAAAEALVRARAFEQGIIAWAAVSDDFPADAATSLHHAGNCHFQLGRYFEALETYARSIRNGPGTMLSPILTEKPETG